MYTSSLLSFCGLCLIVFCNAQQTPNNIECGAADVALVLDNSGSVGSSNFNLMKQFLKNVIDMPEFVIGQTPPRILMGAVKFATSPSFQFNLQQYTNEPALKNAIDAISFTPTGSTNMAGGLQMAHNQIFQTSQNRPNIPDVVVLITDGQANVGGNPVPHADALKADNVHIIVVGIGSGISMTQLQALASDPNEVLHINNFGSLNAAVQDIAKLICDNSQTETCEAVTSGNAWTNVISAVDPGNAKYRHCWAKIPTESKCVGGCGNSSFTMFTKHSLSAPCPEYSVRHCNCCLPVAAERRATTAFCYRAPIFSLAPASSFSSAQRVPIHSSKFGLWDHVVFYYTTITQCDCKPCAEFKFPTPRPVRGLSNVKSLQNELFVKLEEEQEAKQSAARPTSRNLDGAGTGFFEAASSSQDSVKELQDLDVSDVEPLPSRPVQEEIPVRGLASRPRAFTRS